MVKIDGTIKRAKLNYPVKEAVSGCYAPALACFAFFNRTQTFKNKNLILCSMLFVYYPNTLFKLTHLLCLFGAGFYRFFNVFMLSCLSTPSVSVQMNNVEHHPTLL